MFGDQFVDDIWRARTVRLHGVDIIQDSWLDRSIERRAAGLVAVGSLDLAVEAGGQGWEDLVKGDIVGALKYSVDLGDETPEGVVLYAEALTSSGALMAGLEYLEQGHAKGMPEATVLLCRRLYLLGDYENSERVAAELPMHAYAAVQGAQAALMNHRPKSSLRFLLPFLKGAAPLPDHPTAARVALMAAISLANLEQYEQLQQFASNLFASSDLPPEFFPVLARVFWLAGMSRDAWNLYEPKGEGQQEQDAQWMPAARMELAILFGDSTLARRYLQMAGNTGEVNLLSLKMLEGNPLDDPEDPEGLFRAGSALHVWRSHPYRWQPWIDAALATAADVQVYDLARGVRPDIHVIPDMVVDDSLLPTLLHPVAAQVLPVRGEGVWIEEPLCCGAGVGFDWPDSETAKISKHVPLAKSKESAAIVVAAADSLLAYERCLAGLRSVVIAPPGEPFWSGPLPERVWPAVTVIGSEQDRDLIWAGAGDRVVQTIRDILDLREAS